MLYHPQTCTYFKVLSSNFFLNGNISTRKWSKEHCSCPNETVFRIAYDVVPSLKVNFSLDNNREIDITNYNNWGPARPLSSGYFVLIPSDHMSIRISSVANDSRNRRETGSCLLFNRAKISWTELEVNRSEVEVKWLWWEQVLFIYCPNWFMGYLLPAPNEPQTTI